MKFVVPTIVDPWADDPRPRAANVAAGTGVDSRRWHSVNREPTHRAVARTHAARAQSAGAYSIPILTLIPEEREHWF